MAILLSVALGFGIFILSDLRQAIEIDSSVVAYYAADSGIEQTLFLFRKGDVNSIGSLSINDKSGDINDDGINDWTIASSTDYESTFFRQSMYNGQSVKLYFLGRRDGSNISESIKINWTKGFGSPKLEVIFTQLNPLTDDSGPFSSGALVYYTDTDKLEISDTPTSGNPECYDFKDKNLSGVTIAPSDYVVELRVVGDVDGYIDNLSITAHNEEKGISGCNSIEYNDSYNPLAITNITIKSTGNYNNTRQEIYAQIPPFDPASGLLGFVLFSQEDITKGY
jgi:hypothetical protein